MQAWARLQGVGSGAHANPPQPNTGGVILVLTQTFLKVLDCQAVIGPIPDQLRKLGAQHCIHGLSTSITSLSFQGSLTHPRDQAPVIQNARLAKSPSALVLPCMHLQSQNLAFLLILRVALTGSQVDPGLMDSAKRG